MVERVKVHSAFSASSRSKFIKKDKEGVASTVGTIMALLVFLTLLAMFTNTYVPIWMKENEKDHMDVVLNQFGDLKGKVDSLVVNAQVTGRPTINMYQPITLGSDGVPVFATATAGFLYLKPGGGSYDSSVSSSFSFLNDTNVIEQYAQQNGGGGAVEFYGPNRYYVQQWYTYENGALLVYQLDGMAMRASPSLSFVKNNNLVSVNFDQIDIIGTNSSVGGQGSGGIVLDLISQESRTYEVRTSGSPSSTSGQLEIVFTTRYNTTWCNFLNETAQAQGAGLIWGTDYLIQQTELGYDEYRTVYEIKLIVYHVDQFTLNKGYVYMELEY